MLDPSKPAPKWAQQQEKIDAIAEKVMGCIKDRQTIPDSGIYYSDFYNRWRFYLGRPDDRPWNPYESWADCGMVHEAMCKKMFSVRTRYTQHLLEILQHVEGKDYKVAIPEALWRLDKTAICEAALKAVE